MRSGILLSAKTLVWAIALLMVLMPLDEFNGNACRWKGTIGVPKIESEEGSHGTR